MQGSTRVRLIAAVAVAALAITSNGIAAAGKQQDDRPYAGYESDVYSDDSSWLCRPDVRDACDEDLDATIVRADGTTKVERFKRAKRPKIDCFYVYPTVSTDPTTNSDLVPDPALEEFTIRNQAARLQSKCRLFAPVYKQVTLTALLSAQGLGPAPSDNVSREDAGQIAYESMLDAWKHYMANDNKGRGVVLVGHSQGSGLLDSLVAEEIDPNPALREQMISALLLGVSVGVPPGEDVGGDFEQVPLCRAENNLGCVITYESFRPSMPPTAQDGFFGHTSLGPAACTNPGALAGGSAPLVPYFMTDTSNGGLLSILGVEAASPPWLDPSAGEITTPWVKLPGLVNAKCVSENGVGYLALTVNADPAGPRVDDIGGDLPLGFGLHLVDANVAMGDLVRIVGKQAKAYAAR